ncbi:MAG: hypothetical protein U0992_04955 [Planctomycetaceae bacterium]
MLRMQRLMLWTAAILCGCVSMVAAADPPLSGFAGDADVVIRLKNPKATIEKAATMAGTADEKLADQIRENAPFIGVLISNPSLAGVDQEQDWLVVVHAKSDADPAVIFCIPATDAAALQDALPEKMQKFARDGRVYYSEDKAAIETLQKGAPSTSITSEMDSASKEVFDRGDISVFVNVDHLTEVYKDQLEKGTDQLAQRMKNRASILSMMPGADVGSAMDGGAEAGREILKNTRAFTSATTFARTGLNIETLGQFKSGTSTASAMAGHPGDALTTVSRLPEGAVLYFGVSGSLTAGVQKSLQESTALGEPMDDQQQKLDELKKQLAEVAYKSFAGALGLGHREDGILRVASITEAKPTDKVREFTAAAAKLSSVELEGQGIKQEAEYKRDEEKAGDRPVDVMTITTTVDPNVNPFFGSILTQINSFLFGPRGMEMRYAWWDDKFLYALGGGPEAMEAAVKCADGSAPNGTETYRDGLLEKPNVLVLLDVQRIAYRALKAASESPELNLPIDAKVLGKEEPTPSFIGFSAATENEALRSKTQVPSQQLYRIVQLAIFARMAQQRR